MNLWEVRGEARTKRNTNMEWPVEDAGRRRAETKDCHTANIVWDEDEDVADEDVADADELSVVLLMVVKIV